MERVRSLTEQLLAEENAQVAKGRKGVYQTLMLNRIGTTAMAAVSLLALFMYLRQTATLERHTDEEARRIESYHYHPDGSALWTWLSITRLASVERRFVKR